MSARTRPTTGRRPSPGTRSRAAALWLAILAPQIAPAAPPAAAPPRAAAAEVYQRECGDCHVAYLPRLLPAQDWRRIVAALDGHFGVDATLEPADLRVVARWLEAGAGRPRRGETGRDASPRAAAAAGGPGPTGTAPPLPRITTGAWFRHEHDEIGAATWKRPAIGGPARCEACHVDAAKGRFDEDAIRIPR
jgi:hypothetical protein